MKRLLPLLLVLALAGCDDETVTTTATPDSGTPSQPTEQSQQVQPSQQAQSSTQAQPSQQPQAATLVEPGRSCADFQFYKAGQNLGSSATVDPIALSTADQSPIEVYDPASDIGLA